MRTLGLIAISALLFTAACDTSAEGDQGNISFTPTECGRISGCNFDDSIGVGGSLAVQISGLAGASTAGLDVISDDPSRVTAVATSDIGGKPAWELVGVSAGAVRLIAVDASNTEVDSLTVGAQELTGMILDDFIGNAVQTTASADVDETWRVVANEDTSFYVVPTIGTSVPTMGRFTYTATLDAEISTGLLNSADVGNGYLAFNVPAGTYVVTFVNNVGMQFDAEIIAEMP